jgi:hypothetical protein
MLGQPKLASGPCTQFHNCRSRTPGIPSEATQSVQGPGRLAFGAAPLQTGPPGAT